MNSPPLLIIPDRVIPGDGNPPLEGAVVVIRDGVIRAVGPPEALPAAEFQEAQLIEAPGQTLLPGFIDTHVHLTFNAGPNHEVVRSALEKATDAELTLTALRNAQRHLAAGVTTVRDVGGRGMAVPRLRDALRQVPHAAPRIRAAGPAITTPRGHLNYLGALAETAGEVRAWAARVMDAGADLVKICATGGVMTAESDPMRCQYDVAALRGAVETAAARGGIVAAHVLSAEGVRRCVEAGVRSLEHCLLQTTPGEYDFDADLAERMNRDGIWAGLTFAGIGQARYRETVLGRRSAEDLGAWRGRMERRYATERRLIDAGVSYVLHSDAGVRETPFGEFWLIPAAASYELGLSPLAAIRACTQSAARLMGLDDRIGTVSPGRLADLILVDGDPSAELACLSRVRRVYRNGKPVAEDGRVVGEMAAG